MKSSKFAFSPKDRIEHDVYGLGVVEDVNERHTTIAFDEAGRRKFVTRMVTLARSDEPAPTKPVRKKKTTPRPKKT